MVWKFTRKMLEEKAKTITESVLQTTCMPSLCHLGWGSGAAWLFIPCQVQGPANTLTLAQGELDIYRIIQNSSLFIEMCSLALTGQPENHLYLRFDTGTYPIILHAPNRPARILSFLLLLHRKRQSNPVFIINIKIPQDVLCIMCEPYRKQSIIFLSYRESQI